MGTMNSIPSFQQWREGREYDRSFDVYRREFPSVKEYVCVDLDPSFKLSHGDNQPLLETDDLAEACFFVYNRFKELGIECAVYQQRTDGYREIYQHTNRHSKRDASGRFVK